jgi:hypothetical protein
LVGTEQAGKQITGADPLALGEGVNCLLKHHIISHFSAFFSRSDVQQ